ncbi:MAG: serine/threonine protein kinase [Myxococcales bacterium]|nr:serine/threonine protein kinase [Myxococcales bacterium]
MAMVHRAERVDKDGAKRQVALKRLLPRVAVQREARRSFVDEGRLTRTLHHPNIATTFEASTFRETAFIAMEYLPGPTLKQLVQHCSMTVGAVPTPIMLNIACQICDALDYAHNVCDAEGTSLGIIHRDVSPSNIIVFDEGLVKLIDFGLAKARMGTTTDVVGVVKGKFNYVAPEYLEGKLDARADLWALGVVMYELLTSRRLFDGFDDRETLTRVRKLPIPRPSLANPRVSRELDAVVMTALERDPERRWASASTMREALRSVIALPGNYVDNRQLVEWTRWVFTQDRRSEVSGLSMLAMVKPVPAPPPVPTEAPLAELEANHRRHLWKILAVIAIVLLIELIAR